MAIKRQVVIEVDDNGAVKSINDLSGTLKENTSEIEKNTEAQKQLGQESDQAAELIKKQNRDIKVLDGSIKLLGGALETTVGSMALFGISSENIESIQAATLGSIALADGTKRTFEGVKTLNAAFQDAGGLTKTIAENFNAAAIATRAQSAATRVATVVQKGFNAVLALNPAALVVTSIAALVTLIVTLRDRVEVFNKIATVFTNVLRGIGQTLGFAKTEAEKFRDAQAELAEQTEFEIELLKAQGAELGKIRNAEIRLLRQRLLAAEEGSEERKKALQDIQLFNATQARLRREAAEQELEDERQQQEALRQQRQQEFEARKEELNQREQELAKEVELLGLDEADKARLLAKRQFEERIKGFEEGSQAFLDAQKLFTAELDAIEEQEGAEEEAKTLDRLERTQSIIDDFRTRQEDLEVQNEIERLELEKQRTLNELETLEATEEQKLEIVKFFNDQITEARKDANDIQLENDRANKQARLAVELDFANQVSNIFAGLSVLIGQNTKFAKTAALTDIAIQTGVGFVRGLQIAQQSAAAAGPAAAFAFPGFYATQIAAVLNAANQARQILSSAPGPSSLSLPSFGGIDSGVPSTGTTTATDITPEVPEIDEPQPIRAFVLTGDVTTGIEAQSRINKRRTL